VAVVSHFLLQQPVSKPSLIEGVRLVYTLKGDLQLSFRQDVQGIKVTLGEISLPRDDDFEFNPFEWAQASAQAHAATLQELAQLKSTASSEVDTIAKLNAQLDDFIKAKNESETAMLQQFMELLNEKKRKIRDQSRLLAGAKVDRTVGESRYLFPVYIANASRSDDCPSIKKCTAQSSRITKVKAQSSRTGC